MSTCVLNCEYLCTQWSSLCASDPTVLYRDQPELQKLASLLDQLPELMEIIFGTLVDQQKVYYFLCIKYCLYVLFGLH